jgi:hypothetical protein
VDYFSFNTGAMFMGQRRKDRENYWRRMLDRQAESDLSVAEFCGQEDLSAASFYAWRRKLKERDVAASRAAAGGGQLLPVHIEPASPPSLMRILLPQGIVVDVPASVEPATLATLLRVVREAQ